MDMGFELGRDEFGGEQRRLTQREIDIVSLIAAGRSNKAIAIQLGVAPETIKTHLKRIFLKLSARTRAEVAFRAAKYGSLECWSRPNAPPLGQKEPRHHIRDQ
jgi:DNA-binding CsgD family transcriptional regulator